MVRDMNDVEEDREDFEDEEVSLREERDNRDLEKEEVLDEGIDSEKEFSEQNSNIIGDDFDSGFDDFSTSSGNAPVLGQQSFAEQEDFSNQSLEEQMQGVNTSATTDNATNEVSYVKNSPDYGTSDYIQGLYDVMEEEGVHIRRDQEMDISRAHQIERLMHTPGAQETGEQINMRAWQESNLERAEVERDYNVIQKRERKNKGNLPFQDEGARF